MYGDGDTNIGIRLNDNSLIEVIYPYRVAHEYETPRLETVGSRKWGGDPSVWLNDNRDSKYNHRFVIGKFCSSYGESKDVLRVIPHSLIACIEPLPEEKVNQGRLARAKEQEDIRVAAINDPNRYVKLHEVQALRDELLAILNKR